MKNPDLKKIFGALFFLAVFCLPLKALAGPWMDVGDAQLRHHVQVLADAGIINVPVTTWPLMWSGVSEDIRIWQEADNSVPGNSSLSKLQQHSLAYVQRAFHEQGKNSVSQLSVGVRDNINIQSHFGNSQREEQLYQFSTEQMGEWLAFRLQAGYVNDATDEKDYRLDGSYLAGLWGNWQLSVGAVDRWWGPGWHSSMILSNSARPVPGLSLQRNYSDAFSLPLLKWLGPWQLVLFGGQLESDRVISEARLVGVRLSIKPFGSLEIGLSRTAQWGGQGRPESLAGFYDLLAGNDNGDKGITEDANPGNQLGGVDFRLAYPFFGQSLAVYGQIIGEDEADYAPSKRIVMAGVESAFEIAHVQSRIYVEYADSIANGYNGNPLYNLAYEHGVYKSGYRYRGRPLGFALDNDSRELSLAVYHYFANGGVFNWSASKIKLNLDNNNNFPGGHVWTLARQDFWLGDIKYEHPFNNLTLSFGMQYFTDNTLSPNDEFEGAQVYSRLVYSL
ncbi:MAG TPA: capsule assembly Wzi family protein [Pseudomonadales bacterium]